MSIPTPEQAQQLVDHFGSQRAAARAVGVCQETVWSWIHPEKKRERSRRYYAANPEKFRDLHRRYDEANPEKKRERNRRWRETHREHLRAYNRDWYYAQPGLWHARKALESRRRQALKRMEKRNAEREARAAR